MRDCFWIEEGRLVTEEGAFCVQKVTLVKLFFNILFMNIVSLVIQSRILPYLAENPMMMLIGVLGRVDGEDHFAPITTE